MGNKEFETNKKSYNRVPDEKPVKKFDETNHVKIQNESIKDDLLLQTEKKSYNRLPEERDEEKAKTFAEYNLVEGEINNTDEKQIVETERKSYNRLPDEPVKERSVQEQYKSDPKDSTNNA